MHFGNAEEGFYASQMLF